MRLQTFLLIGTALPLALGEPTFAAGPNPSDSRVLLQLAQNETACPEGQECPEAQGGATGETAKQRRERRKQRQQQQQQEQQQQTEPTTEGAEPGATGETAKQRRQRKKQEQQQQQQQQQEQQQQAEPPAEGAEPGATGETAKQRRERRKQQQQQEQQQQTEPTTEGAEPGATGETAKQRRERRKQQQQQEQQQQTAPTTEGAEPGATGETAKQRRERRRQQQQQQEQQPQGDQQGRHQQGEGTDATPPAGQGETPPPQEESTTEQQLDRQGDSQEAKKVRSLRQRLRQQLQEAVGHEEAGQGNNNRPRRHQNEQDSGWQNRDQDRDVIDRRSGRIVINLGNGRISVESVAPDEGGRLLYGADDVEVRNLPHGRTRTIVHRDNGVKIVTVRDRNGYIVRRSKLLPNGTEIVLIDNRYPDDFGENGLPPPPILYDVPPPVIGIPANRYIVDYGGATEEDIRGALLAPPVQRVQRPYTLDEVLQNQEVRAYSPRIDLDTITFDTGSATIAESQMDSLYALGDAMEQVVKENPDEVYLIEGHTDAVGDPNDNLILSDERAEAVAAALSQNFDIPPENLVTKGYGEEFLKVDTEGPEQRNRRATVRRLTELLQAQNQ